MSAEVPEAASAEEQKVSVHGERPQRRGCRGPGLPGGLLQPRAEGRARSRPGASGAESGRSLCASALQDQLDPTSAARWNSGA